MSATARMVEIIDQFVAHVGITPATSDPLNGIEARWEMLRDGGVERPGLAFAAWMDLGLVGGVVPPLLANCASRMSSIPPSLLIRASACRFTCPAVASSSVSRCG